MPRFGFIHDKLDIKFLSYTFYPVLPPPLIFHAHDWLCATMG
jgi:hypothetical protein